MEKQIIIFFYESTITNSCVDPKVINTEKFMRWNAKKHMIIR